MPPSLRLAPRVQTIAFSARTLKKYAERARPLIERIEKRDRDLASQLRRSLIGITLCVAEGFGRRAGNARNLFETARGSLLESHAAFAVAIA